MPDARPFQCSSASRKFLNTMSNVVPSARARVSVLFSEPKIPQFGRNRRRRTAPHVFQCSSASRKFLNYKGQPLPLAIEKSFSALQRAENSSIVCSLHSLFRVSSFSALQRAENSSIKNVSFDRESKRMFQCSSASRKFLNASASGRAPACESVSVLFSEPKIPQYAPHACRFAACSGVSVLFSEPKIPQFAQSAARLRLSLVSVLFSEPKIPQYFVISRCRARSKVSVLFSEPKIPQLLAQRLRQFAASVFQCSSASRKFLNANPSTSIETPVPSFSALQRAENSSIVLERVAQNVRGVVSVLFSEPKIPQCSLTRRESTRCDSFSALQRAENSSMRSISGPRPAATNVSVLFSEPKIPQFDNPRFRCYSLYRVSVLFSEPKIPQS